MSAAGAAVKPAPTTKGVVAFLKIPKDGAPYLAGSKCSKCGEVVAGERDTCGKCGARKGVERWQAVAREAAKQARRPWLVDIAELASTVQVEQRLRDVIAAGGLAVVLHESATRALADFTPRASGEMVLVVGPEGGLNDEELAAFAACGAATCRLGPTVLRTSTAGTVAAAVLFARTARWA